VIRAAIYGRLGGDPINRLTRAGKEWVTVSLAVDVARHGEDQETEWFSISGFGVTAEALARHKKGDIVSVSAQLHRARYTGRDGQERSVWSLTADSIVSARSMRPGSRSASRASRAHRQNTSARDSEPRVASDPVDDLWREEAAT
jgi:single-strand DNA-binding protein